MYRIDTGCKTINGERVDTFIRGIVGRDSLLEAEAGTNGYQGGDTGHGSRTYLRLKDLGGTDIECHVAEDKYGSTSVEIVLGGDTELETMKEALRWMLTVLEAQSETEG